MASQEWRFIWPSCDPTTRVCARVSCTGTENGKGKVQMGPGKHRLCVAGLSLTVNLSGIFCAAPNAGERGITSQDEGLSLVVTADG